MGQDRLANDGGRLPGASEGKSPRQVTEEESNLNRLHARQLNERPIPFAGAGFFHFPKTTWDGRLMVASLSIP